MGRIVEKMLYNFFLVAVVEYLIKSNPNSKELNDS
jgi:hypothetical protein